jgi:hypothetical protein
MLVKIKAWCIKASPPWMLRWKANHPKSFWATMTVLVILPLSPVTFALIRLLSSIGMWFGLIK